jgi:CheY-like chemotaxis protein
VPSLVAGRRLLESQRPGAVILDILLPGEEQQTWRWLSEEKARADPLPVIVVSQSDDARKALSLGADAYFAKPVSRAALLDALERLVGAPPGVALIIDDDEAARYVIRRSLRRPMRFEEAADGKSGIALAARCRPNVIFLDLAMPGMHGDEVLDRLKADPATAGIPVVVVTSVEVDPALRDRLKGRARAILRKRDISVETLALTLDGLQHGAAP